MKLRLQKGQYFNHLLLSFIKKDNIIFLCHANNMSTDFILKLKKELKNINFNMKFFKKKPLLESFNKISSDYQILNGSLLVIYSNDPLNVNSNIFKILNNNTDLILLTTIWNKPYSNIDTSHLINKFNLNNLNTNLFKFNTTLKLQNLIQLKFKLIFRFNSLKNIKILSLLKTYKKKLK